MPPYVYQTPVNPYAASISATLEHGGEIAAQRAHDVAAAQAQGQVGAATAWAGAARGIGDAVSGTVQRLTDPSVQLQQQQVARNARTQKYLDMSNGLATQATSADGSIDPEKLRALMSQAGLPLDVQSTIASEAQGLDGYAKSSQSAKNEGLASAGAMLYHALQALPKDASPDQQHAVVVATAGLAKGAKLASDADLQQVFGGLADGAPPLGLATRLMSLSPSKRYDDLLKPVKLAGAARPGAGPETLVDPNAPAGAPPIASGAPAGAAPPTDAALAMDAATLGKPNQTPTAQQSADALAKLKPAPPPVSQEWKDVLLDGKPAKVFVDPKTRVVTTLGGQVVNNADQRIKPVPPASMTVNPALVPSGDALSMAAKRYLATGELPSMGMGSAGAAARVAIMNEAAKLDPQASLSLNKATYKADSANLQNLQKTEGTLSAFETTAGKNLDQFLSLANKIPDTGVPWLNTPVRMLNKAIVGSANMAAIDAARDVALREIARVTNDPKMSGALTDSARQEISALSPKNATLPQIKAVVKVLQQDMANVHSGLTQQIASVKDGLSQHPGAPPPSPSGDRVRVKGPNGQTGTVPKGSTLPAGWSAQ